jgi:hypothetical protein
VATAPPSTTQETATAGPTPSVSQARSSYVPIVGATARTVESNVRVRSAPGTGGDSALLKPLLPAGTWLYVVDGPVRASTYDWYLVVPVETNVLPSGWVARASRSGTPWVTPTVYPCPPVPTSMGALAALRANVGLACFAGVPISVKARLVDCNCDVDALPVYDPEWFGWPGGTLIVPPSADRAPVLTSRWFGLILDPDGDHPDPLPVGRYLGGASWSDGGVVEVSGLFDHPAAAACTVTQPDATTAVATPACRSMFAVTRIAPAA